MGFIIFCVVLFVTMFLITIEKSNSNNSNSNKIQINKIEKGIEGEEIIKNNIKDKLDIYYRIITNVYIKNNDKTTEIDLILITAFGIFVIESKNFNGKIYGKEEEFYWTQYFYKGKSIPVKNPIKQNQYHIYFLSKYLSLDEKYFYSYIVFGDNTEIKKVRFDNSKRIRVLNNRKLVSSLIDDMHEETIKLSHEEIDKIYIDLNHYNQHSRI